MAVLTNNETGHKMTLPISVLSDDPDLIQQISPIEANRIGFIAGLQQLKKLFLPNK